MNKNTNKNMEAKIKKENNKEDLEDDCQHIFPQRLMSVLSDDSNADAICWLPHGRAFTIKNRILFADKVMPNFFPRKSKYSSFTRKLNRWNFVRVSSGPELGAYYHEFFLRDQPHLAAQMFCKNARTKIAMASCEPEPASLQKLLNYQQEIPQVAAKAQSPEQSCALLDPSHFLMSNNPDSAMQMLLEKQLSLCNRSPFNTQQTQQVQQGLTGNALNMLLGGNGASKGPVPGVWLQQEILAQKQQQQRMLQLRQLMALNFRQQSKKDMHKKNFRASAA